MNNTPNDNNQNIIDDIIPSKRITNRIKRLQYADDRKAVADRILEIIGISETNKIFYSHLLDENKEIQEAVLALDDEIKRVFPVSTWNAYKQGNEKIERRYLSIIKSVLKSCEIKYTSVSQKMNYKGLTINTTLYTIE